jgi:glycosyltransferase involved in cell wall biosynthesis
VTRLGLSDTVEFAGWRQDAARSVLPALDVFVQSSHWEAMSIVLLEAMAAGCPIVATAVGENPLVLKQGETGILVPPGDPEALAQGLTRLLQNEPLRRRLADAARESYEASFTATAMAQRYDATYKELLRRNRPNG